MILDDSIATSVLAAVFQAAGKTTFRVVRISDVERLTNLDPGAVRGAIGELMKAGLLQPGSTDDRVCVNAAGAACARNR